MSQFYKATKEGYDGKQVRKEGEVFPFSGPRGSWMVPCDEHGHPTEAVTKQRDTRLGSKVSSNLTREDLREECRKLGISFRATAGAAELAALIQKHSEGKPVDEKPDPGKAPSEKPETEAGKGAGGTGNQDVL